jgi:hypothetical protein
MRVRFDLISSINRGFPCLGRGCIVLFAMLLIVPALASNTWSAPSATAFSVQTVDRAHKADRLPLRRDPRYWLEHDSVVLAMLAVGITIVMLLALSI